MAQGTDPQMRQVFADLSGGDRAKVVAGNKAETAASIARNIAAANQRRDVQVAAATAEAAAILANKP